MIITVQDKQLDLGYENRTALILFLNKIDLRAYIALVFNLVA